MANETIRISKLEAARRQLKTAISLWFDDGDPVAIHTLAFAAYEVMHSVSEQRDPNRRDLLFDCAMIKDEYRRDWNRHIRKEANFFKHADKDGDSVIEFKPALSEYFIMFSIAARELCGEVSTDEEAIFCHWLMLNRPSLVLDEWKNLISNTLAVDNIKHLRTLSKSEFFEVFQYARAVTRRSSHVSHFSMD